MKSQDHLYLYSVASARCFCVPVSRAREADKVIAELRSAPSQEGEPALSLFGAQTEPPPKRGPKHGKGNSGSGTRSEAPTSPVVFGPWFGGRNCCCCCWNID